MFSFAHSLLCMRSSPKIYCKHTLIGKQINCLLGITRGTCRGIRGSYISSKVCISSKAERTGRRNYGVRSGQSFTTMQATEQFVQWLMPEERKALFQALIKYQSAEDINSQVADEEASPTFYQLQLVIFSNAIPFIGFGFLDNAIMILAGDYIDKTIGITLGISTMAAAALGNLISDLLGIGYKSWRIVLSLSDRGLVLLLAYPLCMPLIRLAGYVETLAAKLGFDMPPLTPTQASMWQTIYSSYIGRALGIVIGCLVGMFPLLLLDKDEDRED